MNQQNLDEILYSEDISKATSKIREIFSEDELLYIVEQYNWDNGFDIPKAILDNKVCSLEIALTIFYDAEGISYLEDKTTNDGLKSWREFIIKLYEDILKGTYVAGNSSFTVPLSKVQLYKLKKILSEEEMIFVQDI